MQWCKRPTYCRCSRQARLLLLLTLQAATPLTAKALENSICNYLHTQQAQHAAACLSAATAHHNTEKSTKHSKGSSNKTAAVHSAASRRSYSSTSPDSSKPGCMPLSRAQNVPPTFASRHPAMSTRAICKCHMSEHKHSFRFLL